MSVALRLYEQLTEAGEDKTRAKLIAEAFEHLEDRYPQLKDVATQGQVRETELRLQKDIESVRLEIKEVEGKLQRQIESVRLEIKEVEGKLQREIESVRLEIKEVEAKLRLEIEKTRLEIKQVEVRLTRAIHRQTLWTVGSVGTVIGLIRLLEWLLAHVPTHG
ncbi:hypothetical protein ABZN20_05390 [Methylococcus sp. ANG]|uniref:hypothetical protein n=1 Tax=Methylococcus sp. ANG TaxID=3231903 RepID=UPI00345A642C